MVITFCSFCNKERKCVAYNSDVLGTTLFGNVVVLSSGETKYICQKCLKNQKTLKKIKQKEEKYNE